MRRKRSRYSYYQPRRTNRFGWLKPFAIVIALLLLISTTIFVAGKYLKIGGNSIKIDSASTIYAGTKKPIKIKIESKNSLSGYQVIFIKGDKSIVGPSGKFDIPIKKTEIDISLPKELTDSKKSVGWSLVLSVRDKSLWRFVGKNVASKTIKIVEDDKPPLVKVLATSETIARGGSALVVFEAKDANLKDAYVMVNNLKFEATPYRKDGYWATLIAWDFRQKHLKIYAVATDTAGNKTTKEIKIAPIKRRYRVSNIVISDKFIDGKITTVASRYPKIAHIKDKLKRFKAVNETLRIDNERKIHELAKRLSKKMMHSWKIRAFYPLKGAKLVADFGGERHYFYKDKTKQISTSFHMGYDLASVRHAPIVSSNSGIVVNASRNGIYGNMPMIDHGFGLYTLYGHCSKIFVKKSQKVKAGEVIARTGTTGLALGDHLHFGILVHGVEVWPMDWMRGNWIKKNIKNVFEKANKLIEKENDE